MNVMDSRATSALLYLDGVHVSFDRFNAINNLSLALEPGEMRAIIRHDELSARTRKARPQRPDGMPFVGDVPDPLATIDAVISRVPRLHQQLADGRQIAFTCAADEHAP